MKNKPTTLTVWIALGLLAPAAWAQSGSRFAAPLPQSGAASAATIPWGTRSTAAPAAAPAAAPVTRPAMGPAVGPATGPATHPGTRSVVPSTGTRSISEILALPDSQVLPAAGGGSTTAGEVKRRYAQWMKGELARRKPAAPVRMARQGAAKVPRVDGVMMASGAALRQADPALLNELRGLDTATLVRSGTTVGQVSLQGPGRKLVGAPMAPAVPCTSAQAAFANGSAHYLSTVNKRPKDFWIDLDADERTLVLSGCFDKTPGEVRIQGHFPGGQVKAQVVLWEERVIVAQMPVMTGLVDQDISVRVVLANQQSTNERSGHLWAKREEKQLDDLALYASTGDCPGRAFRSPQGPSLQAGYPPKYLEGTHSEGALTPSPVTAMKTCELPQGAVAPSGVTHFKARLAPGWEVVNLSLRAHLGNARREWVGESDFDVHWTAASFKASHEVLGIPTGTELFHALGFAVDQVVVRGPAGTSHLARGVQ